MDSDDLTILPAEARPYQGEAAGVATRVVASTIDVLVVGGSLLVAYAGFAALLLVLDPRGFRAPDLPPVWVALAYFDTLVVYLTLAWWIGGRTLGARLMGLQVVSRRGRLRFGRALARAVMCAGFPIGLLWCAVDPRRRSLHDIVLRTAVVYNWLPRR